MAPASEYSEDSAPILGFADGVITSSPDLGDYTISRLGGFPVFPLSAAPPVSCSDCVACKKKMPLLTQIYCPLPESNFDRVLYVWGCEDKECQRKGKSVRAWRATRWNESFAAASAEEEQEKDEKPIGNPFMMNAEAATISNGLGNLLFDPSPAPMPAKPKDEKKGTPPAPSKATSSHGTSWKDTSNLPSYAPQYVDTLLEPPPPKKKAGPAPPPPSSSLESSGGPEWTNEAYERPSALSSLLSVDDIFVEFQDRVRPFPNQVVRHDFGGVPLAFTGKGETFDLLFPLKEGEGEDEDEVDEREFDSSKVARCEKCKSKRVFELQLMPALEEVWPKVDEVEGEEEAEKKKGRGRWEWSTVFVLSCEKECAEEVGGVKEAWREEKAFLQFED
ncbi:hypothetical protein BT69DRAFT_1315678 [Atractiella rhizophila]|nr:hypothetical protein BT69DRAFT_1315678 [Atractiella rhizophila]